MSDEKLPDYETLEKTFKTAPEEVLSRLPDCIESREAKRLIPIVTDLVYHAREQAKHEPVPAETPSEASMRRARESGIAWFRTELAAPAVTIPHASTGLCCCERCWSAGC
jgi:hypothetical protein